MNTEHDRERHKSKFNSGGKKEKKGSKRKGPEKNKIRPGSEEELQFLVSTLKNSCIGADYATIIDETVFFLSQVGHLDLSQQVYETYEALRKAVDLCQTDRLLAAAKERLEMTRKARMEGIDEPSIILPCEAEVDTLRCENLSTTLAELFSYFISK
jgi:hypothetical protein